MTVEQFVKSVERVQGPLRRFLCTLCHGDKEQADDLAQEALLKAYLHINKFKGKSKFSTWLYRIAYFTFLDWNKTIKRKKEISLESTTAQNLISPKESPKNYDALYNAIDDLTKNERICILLFYIEEKSIAEISIITDMPIGTIKSHLSRGRSNLKTKLKTVEEWK